MEYTYSVNSRSLIIQYYGNEIIHCVDDTLHYLFRRKMELRLIPVSPNDPEYLQITDDIWERVKRIAEIVSVCAN